MARTFDLAIRGATVISDGALPRDVLIRGGRVAALVEPGAADADEEIDARGLYALPGAVDAHVHFNEPGRTVWEGWERGSRGAAAGGTTTVVDMPLNSLPPTLDGVSFDAKRVAAERSSVVDFALWGGLVSADRPPLRELAERGAVGVKGFLCDSGVPEFPSLPGAALGDALAAAKATGLLVALHCEDEALVREATTAALRQAPRDLDAWSSSRPVEAERRAVARACAAAKATGASLHVVHLSSAAALDVVALSRSAGVDVSVETCPHYLVFDDDDLRRAGAALKCAPPIRSSREREALWEALLGGRIDLVASDHSPCAAESKQAPDAFAAWGGVTGVQSLLPSMLSAALRRAAGTPDPAAILGFIAWRLAARPAQRLGLWPRKGRIAAGSDADIVLLDVRQKWTLEPAALETRSGQSPYLGRTFRGLIHATLVRGRIVYRDGRSVADPGYGRFVRPDRG